MQSVKHGAAHARTVQLEPQFEAQTRGVQEPHQPLSHKSSSTQTMQTGLQLKVPVGQFYAKVGEIRLAGEFDGVARGTNTSYFSLCSPPDMRTQPPFGNRSTQLKQ